MSKRVSSTVTKRKANPRPRKYASASERQAAYRDRAPEVCFRAEPKTVETLDRIADTIDRSRAELLLSMTKFALTNHDWARFGLTHKPLPFGYGTQDETRKGNPMPIKWTEYNIPGVEGKTYEAVYKGFRATVAKRGGVWSMLLMRDNKSRTPLGSWNSNNGQASGAKAWFEIVVDNWDSLKEKFTMKAKTNPTTKRKPTPAQLAARERFAEMARSGAFKKAGGRKANPAARKWLVLPRTGKTYIVGSFSSEQAAKDYMQTLNAPWNYKVKRASPERAPRKANPDGMGSYGPFYGATDAPMTEAQIERKAESYMDRLDRQLMGNEITQTVYDREVKALDKWTKEQYAKRRRRNPAKPAATRRGNPAAARRVKFVCIAPLEYSGSKYGIDERTPVTMKFSEREMKLAHKCYQLPEKVVMNDNFQNFAYHNKVIYMSVADLRKMLREYV
jgi:hypothetical protein